MISPQQIDLGCEFIKNVIADAFLSMDYEIQDGGLSVIFFVELFRPFSSLEELLCTEQLKQLEKIISPNKKRSSPVVTCKCRHGYGKANYSFLGFSL